MWLQLEVDAMNYSLDANSAVYCRYELMSGGVFYQQAHIATT